MDVLSDFLGAFFSIATVGHTQNHFIVFMSLKCVKRTVYFDLQAGSSWVANCTRFDCMETAVGAVVLASGVVCPPFNDTECIQV